MPIATLAALTLLGALCIGATFFITVCIGLAIGDALMERMLPSDDERYEMDGDTL